MKNDNQNPDAKSDNEGAEQNQESSGSWPAMELPDCVIDNNIFADWTNFEKAISDLGSSITPVPAHAPFIKPCIERIFRTTDSAFITSLHDTRFCQTKRTEVRPSSGGTQI